VKLTKKETLAAFHTGRTRKLGNIGSATNPAPMRGLSCFCKPGHARSDAVRMGRHRVKSGKLSMRRTVSSLPRASAQRSSRDNLGSPSNPVKKNNDQPIEIKRGKK
jgi:hypothetical protein